MFIPHEPQAAGIGEVRTQDLLKMVKVTYKLLIDDLTADAMQQTIKTALETNAATEFDVRGRNLVSGLPVTMKIQSGEIERILKQAAV